MPARGSFGFSPRPYRASFRFGGAGPQGVALGFVTCALSGHGVAGGNGEGVAGDVGVALCWGRPLHGRSDGATKRRRGRKKKRRSDGATEGDAWLREIRADGAEASGRGVDPEEHEGTGERNRPSFASTNSRPGEDRGSEEGQRDTLAQRPRTPFPSSLCGFVASSLRSGLRDALGRGIERRWRAAALRERVHPGVETNTCFESRCGRYPY